MRIKKSGAYLLMIPVVLFFAYFGYKDLIFNSAAEANSQVSAVLEKNETERTLPPREYFGHRRAQIALQEYMKDVVETPRGCNCGKEVDKYTDGTPMQWCTLFASWVAKEAGSPFINGREQTWKISNSRELAQWLEENGTWHSREEVVAKNLKPEVGDYVLFWRGKFEDRLGHVDVVINAKEGGIADLVGGNLKDRVQYRENFPYMQNWGFLGYGRPEKN